MQIVKSLNMSLNDVLCFQTFGGGGDGGSLEFKVGFVIFLVIA